PLDSSWSLSSICCRSNVNALVFFFNATSTSDIYTLSLHDALPISSRARKFSTASFCLKNRLANAALFGPHCGHRFSSVSAPPSSDRKSTRLNSSHSQTSYAVFCLQKKTSDHDRSNDFKRFPDRFTT